MRRYLVGLAVPLILSAANQTPANDPFAAMAKMQREMDAEMARMQAQMSKAMASGNVISLNANMSDSGFKPEGDHYELSVQIPEASQKSIHIRTRNHIMTVTASHQLERDSNSSGQYYQEQRMSSYAYSFAIPADAQTEHMKTKYKKGVLTITLPKKS